MDGHLGKGGAQEAGHQGAECGGLEGDGDHGWGWEAVVGHGLLDGEPGAGFFSRVGEAEGQAVGQEQEV